MITIWRTAEQTPHDVMPQNRGRARQSFAALVSSSYPSAVREESTNLSINEPSLTLTGNSEYSSRGIRGFARLLLA
jgi:hypothetical protein